MQFPSAAPPETKEFPIQAGADSFMIIIRKPTFAQLAEDEDRQMKCEGLRIHRLKSCVHNWSGLQNNGQDVGYSIYNLFALADAHPEVLVQVNELVDPLFDMGADRARYLQPATLRDADPIDLSPLTELPRLIADAVKVALAATPVPLPKPVAVKPAGKPAAKPVPVEEASEEPPVEEEAAA